MKLIISRFFFFLLINTQNYSVLVLVLFLQIHLQSIKSPFLDLVLSCADD